MTSATDQTGIGFNIYVGPVEGGDPRGHAERLLQQADRPDGAVLLYVAPGERRVEVVTSPAARRRITDNAAALAVLTMTASFGVGDLTGGIVNGLRQLADSAGQSTISKEIRAPRP